ncbi:thioredoxin family protein [Methylocucumis oryzae]|uniref:Alkyl hydroperoxide reductase n=1 Tax=Methylocucumis oryzae TaxID=1632867 RepID=A0A0F3IQQ6_9GAMM|nr:thioredoxin family protein [Methylocucumis oryzae]KJV07934.1 alkyl hydroperoxide reductase [Methylocucumis oryzae]
MVLLETPLAELGRSAPDFELLGVDGRNWRLHNCVGERGLLVMFICNHCPYVKAIQTKLIRDTLALSALGVGSVAIMPNDAEAYPDDSFANMQRIAQDYQYPFPYLYDETQAVAKAYGAICTPDFFGYNAELKLQYRGRLDASRKDASDMTLERELFSAMQTVAETGIGPQQQIPSMGCSIKWK